MLSSINGLVFSRGLFMSHAAAGLVLVRANNKKVCLSSDREVTVPAGMLATNMHVGLSSDSARTGVRAAATNIGVLALFERPRSR